MLPEHGCVSRGVDASPAIWALLAAVGFGPTEPELIGWVPPSSVLRVRLSTGLQARALAALTRSVAAAEEKLARPRCQEVFQDFNDLAGRRLDVVLFATGRRPESLLRDLEFADGSASSICTDRTALVWTHPGARTIYLCASQFADATQAGVSFVANLLIHESLHSLGLGENPPSSQRITARVADRCGY